MSISPTQGAATSYFVAGTPATAASATAGGTGVPGSTSTSSSTSTSPTVDKDMFLKLMVEQLKNQDPMNPTDSSQFLAQTAQFTSLEKLEAMADSSSQALSAQMSFGASGLVGRTVTFTGADGVEGTGAVGSVRFTSNGPLLGVNGQEVEIGSVTKVAG
jgi:flagellar basal-body rod modification protein FlgD